MVSWSNLVKKDVKNDVKKDVKNDVKNDVKRVKVIKKVTKQQESDDLIICRTYGLKNEEDEFELIYSHNLNNIIVEFRDFLHNSSFKVFPNNKLGIELYDFIKYYSHTYDELVEEVDKFNDNLEKELDEEDEQYYYYY